MLSELLLFILWSNNIDSKEKKSFIQVFTEMQWPKAQVEDPALGQLSNFLYVTILIKNRTKITIHS